MYPVYPKNLGSKGNLRYKVLEHDSPWMEKMNTWIVFSNFWCSKFDISTEIYGNLTRQSTVLLKVEWVSPSNLMKIVSSSFCHSLQGLRWLSESFGFWLFSVGQRGNTGGFLARVLYRYLILCINAFLFYERYLWEDRKKD